MNTPLIYPMLAMVLLTFSVLVMLFITRLRLVNSRAVSDTQYLTYQGNEPESAAKISRNFVNLFEAPVLFYVVCLAATQLGIVEPLFVTLAWVYVGLRVVHTVIHVGPNVLLWRIGAYFSSWAILLALWVLLGVAVV